MLVHALTGESQKIVKKVLSNGLTVLLKPMPVKECLIGLAIKGGAIESSKQGYPNGTAHLLEHVLINRIPRGVRDKMNINGKTSQTHISVYGHTKENSSRVLTKELLSSISHPVNQKSINEEVPRVLKEISMVSGTHSDQQEKFITAITEDPHLLNSSILGTEETIKNISKDYLQRFLRSTAVPGSVLLVGMGNIDVPGILNIAKSIKLNRPSTELLSNKESTSLIPKYAQAQTSTDPAANNNLFLMGYKFPWNKNIKSYATYLVMADSIQRALDPSLGITAHLSYSQLGGVLYFTIPTKAYSKQEFTSIIQKATRNIQKDLSEFKYEEGLMGLPHLDISTYLFSIGLGPTSTDDLFDAIKSITDSDISEGVKALNISNCYTSTDSV
ncbi:hypothetical protein NEPAR04_1962 [Nematocida parisii]|nr:hypothetical protein NEPAR04_1962 [Nematocida parisii]